MNNSIEMRLAARHRSLLFQHTESVQEVFGFECLDGWSDLIEGTLRLIHQYAELSALDVKITQGKEKFGQLRIYQHGGDESVGLAIDIAELVSGCVCELCSGTGEIAKLEGWLVARCDQHRGLHPLEQTEPRSADEHYIASYARTVGLILSFFGASAVHWVQQECIGLAGRRPYEMLGTKAGCDAVYTLLKKIEYGVGV